MSRLRTKYHFTVFTCVLALFICRAFGTSMPHGLLKVTSVFPALKTFLRELSVNYTYEFCELNVHCAGKRICRNRRFRGIEFQCFSPYECYCTPPDERECFSTSECDEPEVCASNGFSVFRCVAKSIANGTDWVAREGNAENFLSTCANIQSGRLPSNESRVAHLDIWARHSSYQKSVKALPAPQGEDTHSTHQGMNEGVSVQNTSNSPTALELSRQTEIIRPSGNGTTPSYSFCTFDDELPCAKGMACYGQFINEQNELKRGCCRNTSTSCRCYRVFPPSCKTDDDCLPDESCFTLGGRLPKCIATSYQEEQQNGYVLAYNGVCIDASALQLFKRHELVFKEHVPAVVLCDRLGSCATKTHMVQFQGKPMSMATFCKVRGCVERVMDVNSPRYQPRLRIDSKTPELQYTALSASYETQVEEIILSLAIKMGL